MYPSDWPSTVPLVCQAKAPCEVLLKFFLQIMLCLV